MNKAKFSKGPWSEVPQHAAGPMIARVIETGQQMTPTRLRLIAHMLERGDSIGEDRANAHLIAAAPELYEALEGSEALIKRAQSFLLEYLLPLSKVTEGQVINNLLECFDGPYQREIQGANQAALQKARGE